VRAPAADPDGQRGRRSGEIGDRRDLVAGGDGQVVALTDWSKSSVIVHGSRRQNRVWARARARPVARVGNTSRVAPSELRVSSDSAPA
jgi:hypothetical protein